jgi:hypothetical protein
MEIVTLVIIAVAAGLAIGGTVHSVHADGYHRLPTRQP